MKKLERSDLKKIAGGIAPSVGPCDGSCCWHGTGWGTYTCGLSGSSAQSWQEQLGGYWCCSSCCESYKQSWGQA